MKRTFLNVTFRALIVLPTLCLLATTRAADPPANPPDLESEALFKVFVPPVYPDEALKAKRDGRVEVDFIVDENGNVTEVKAFDSTDPMFEAPALDAVRQWKFEPALDAGKPVAMGMSGTVVFSAARLKNKKPTVGLPPMEEWPHASRKTPARAVSAPDPDYPDELYKRKLQGRVDLELVVGPDGRVSSRRVLWASHGAFVAEALRVSDHWTFEPAHQGLLAISWPMRSPVNFAYLGARPAEICAANGLKVEDESVFDSWPEPVSMAEPIFPSEQLLAGETGTAQSSFTINASGGVEDFLSGDCSAPGFGASLAAAVETWLFRPATKDGNGVPVRVTITQDFRTTADGPLSRLAAKLKEGSIGSARGLDGPIQMLWRGFPAYPEALKREKPEGDAIIEMIIDSDGRARLPRIISATKPEFGWAAAAAVNQWVFAPPRRDGGPTEVRVRVPMHFTAGE